MNYVQLYNAIQNYAENTEALFVASIPRFVMEAEDRIYNSVQIPSLRKNVTGNMTASNPYLSLPSDYLSTYSLAVIDGSGNYTYLINKDVNFIREAYSSPSYTGTPKYYALFGNQYNNFEALSALIGPTPDSSYSSELHYFYYPPTIVQGQIATLRASITGGTGYVNGTYENVPFTNGSGMSAIGTFVVSGTAVTSVTLNDGGQFYVVGDTLNVSNAYLGGIGSGFACIVATVTNATGTTWLGDNYDPVLFYGSMREAMLFMKGEQDLVGYYEQKYQEALQELRRLGDGLERGDAYRDGQLKLNVAPRNQVAR
jgi:hypothetical protein